MPKKNKKNFKKINSINSSNSFDSSNGTQEEFTEETGNANFIDVETVSVSNTTDNDSEVTQVSGMSQVNKRKNNKYAYPKNLDLQSKYYTSNSTKLFSLLFAVLAIVFVLVSFLHVVPNVIFANTDQARAEMEKKSSESSAKARQDELKVKLEEENKTLAFIDQKVNLKIKDYGDLKINLKDKAAPQTTENFIRLVSRGYYNGLGFHRIVKQENFSVIQGGDPQGDGKGGESASGKGIPDELWETKPEFETQNETTRGQIKNEPKFKDETLYKDYNKVTGEVIYAKGLILMAKTNQPDSATSQFFVTLSDTKLPAQYTVFGVVDSNNYDALDKIKQNVNPISSNPTQTGEVLDGKPDKSLIIEKAEIIK